MYLEPRNCWARDANDDRSFAQQGSDTPIASPGLDAILRTCFLPGDHDLISEFLETKVIKINLLR